MRLKDIAQSSCQADVDIINETTKLVLEYSLLFRDIGSPLAQPVEKNSNNQGTIQWLKGLTTKMISSLVYTHGHFHTNARPRPTCIWINNR